MLVILRTTALKENRLVISPSMKHGPESSCEQVPWEYRENKQLVSTKEVRLVFLEEKAHELAKGEKGSSGNLSTLLLLLLLLSIFICKAVVYVLYIH